jgi:hypothetical protein
MSGTEEIVANAANLAISDIAGTAGDTVVSDSALKNAINVMLDKNMNYATWKNYLKLYRFICHNNGLIFGGATRDYVKRSIAAKKFATFCKENKINFKKQYMNSDINPDTFQDRTLLPNDIDVYIHEKDFNILLKDIIFQYMHYELKTCNPSYLFTNNEVLKESINHYVYEIDFLGKNGSMFLKTVFNIDFGEQFRIKIDYIVLKNDFVKHRDFLLGGYMFPPFGNPDFDVNQLYMQYNTFDGFTIKINPTLLHSNIDEYSFNAFDRDDNEQKIKAKIFKNIENNIAVPIMPNLTQFNKVLPITKPRINLGRLAKMVNKNYKVTVNDTLTYDKTYIKAPEDYKYNEEDKCIICFDTFSDVKPWFQMGCECGVKMHLLCMSKYVRNPSMNESHKMTCPHCRTPFQKCHCQMFNFINSLKHKGEVLEHKTKCHDCTFNIDSVCSAWYKPCTCCKF